MKYEATHVIDSRTFEKLVRVAGGREEQWQKRPFSYQGALFYPGMIGLYQITAAELVPAEQYRGKTFDDQFGSFSKPGFTKRLGQRSYVFAGFHRFVLEGTHLSALEPEARAASGGSQASLFAEP